MEVFWLRPTPRGLWEVASGKLLEPTVAPARCGRSLPLRVAGIPPTLPPARVLPPAHQGEERALEFCPSRSNTYGGCPASHDARDLAGAAAPGPDGPGRLGRVRRALRAAPLPLVPAVETPERRLRGRDPGHPGEARPEAAHFRLRSVAQLPRLAQDARAPC